MQQTVTSVRVELAAFPVVLFEEQGPTANAKAFLDAFEQVLARGVRFASIHDVRNIHGWEAFDRIFANRWVRHHHQALRNQVRGHCVVVNGPDQRGMATAVFLGTGFEHNIQVFEDDLSAAYSWATDRVL